MKRYIYSIFVLVLFAFVGCVKTDEQDNNLARRGEVLLSLRTTSGLVTRATAEDIAAKEDTSLEERVDWVDVFVFEANGTDGAPGGIFHKERIDVSSAPVYKSGEFALAKKREEFGVGTPYYVYLVANAKANLISDEAGVTSWADLQNLVQTDQNLHFSAFVDAERKPAFADAPARFLMDGFAYLGNAANPSASVAPEQMGTCVINDPNASEILLCGTIYRAAAKFIINIKQGANVEFQKELKGADNLYRKPQYYINQLPVSTRVLPQQATDYYIATTQNTATTGLNPYTFEWTDAKTAGASGDDGNKMTITGYGYSDDWSKLEYTKQTSMLFNLPMKWDKDKNAENGKEASTADNWYSIPLSKEKRFERNTCYIINVTVNAVGAEEKEYAIELKDIEYTTQPWNEVTVDIGGYDAAYLTLNTDLVKIYDTNIDKDQLTFASSSPIKSIRLADVYKHNADGTFQVVKKSATGAGDNYQETYAEGDGVWAYYIDKFGQSNQLGSDPGFDIKDVDHPEWTKAEILAKEKNLYAKEGAEKQYIRAEIWEGQEYALNGNITIHSPINAVADNDDLDWNSHFNTVRYLEFVVENEQGITATFRVEQTPVTVISNIEGFFSYRSDFCINGLRMHYNYDAFAKGFPILPTGQNKFADKRGPIHYLNPNEPFWAVAIFIPYHVHECYEDGQIISQTCGTIDKNNSTNGELVYGLMHSSRDTYRSHGPDAGVFHRDHYTDANGRDVPEESKISNGAGKYYQAIGLPYKDEVTGKYYRRHYVGQGQATFWAKYVMESLKEDRKDAKGNVIKRRGLADITLQVPGADYFPDGNFYWGGQGANKTLVNHRMYNVCVTSTSTEYTVSLPAMMDENGKPTFDRSQGYTMEGLVNSRVVSPSFTIASQLGSTSLPVNEGGYSRPGVAGFYEYAKHQCREYVETYYVDDDNSGGYTPGDRVYHYDDWRLPTKAEIDYIIQHQKTSRAMDKVMNAQYYFVASLIPDNYTEETVYSSEITDYASGYAGHFMRCVRDAIIEPEPVIYDANYDIVSGKPVKSN